MSEHRLVNLRGYAVEVHLPDRVVVLDPWDSLPFDPAREAVGSQVEELVRHGFLEIRQPEEAPRAKPARQRRPRTRPDTRPVKR